MYTINFKTLSVRNFLSVGETPLLIEFKDGINVITGINRDKEDSKNGVGKSTIIDALYFALYGSTIRELTKDLIVNSHSKKNCVVRLNFEVAVQNVCTKYTIIRQLSPAKCTLLREEEDVTLSTMPKTNEYIQSIIRTAGNVFQNSVVMTTNNTTPFMAQSRIDKRRFIENILNLEIFSKMLSSTREEYNFLKKEYELVSSKHETLVNTNKNNITQLEFFETSKVNRITEIKDRITKCNTDIEVLRGGIKEVPTEAFTIIENKLNELNVILKNKNEDVIKQRVHVESFSNELSKVGKLIKHIDDVGAICTTCNRPYATEDTKHRLQAKSDLLQKNTDLNNKIDETKILQNKLCEDLQLTRSQLDTYSEKKQKLNAITFNNEKCRDRIKSVEELISRYTLDADTVLRETNHILDSTIKQINGDIDVCTVKINNLNDQLVVLEHVKFLVSEEGVKSYIIKKIIDLLNMRLQHYLTKLQANCTCTFNEYFEDVVIDEFKNVRSYFNFSGGERKRIDLACLFAFLDIRRLQGDVNFNIIFYDELIDSALDEKGVELVLGVLRERSNLYQESSYIITHRGSTVLDSADRIIMLEKRNNTTYLL